MTDAAIWPVKLYGSSISYFTGKLENYFRVKGIPYQLEALARGATVDLVKEKTGSTQMPAVELADGRWLSDSTPIIQWFETQTGSPGVMPQAPLQRFFVASHVVQPLTWRRGSSPAGSSNWGPVHEVWTTCHG